MSFVKLPRKYSTRQVYVHNAKRKKKPVWDDTISDLSVHRATSEELQRRKEVTTSKNMDSLETERIKKKISKSSNNISKRPPRKGRSAIMKEVLYDASQLQDALAKSDKMMSVVRDLFGDDPMKYKGLPHVTSAPGAYYENDSTLPEGSFTEEPSKLDQLSGSIMDKSALNELETASDDYESDVSGGESYQSGLDFDRFKQLLAKADAEIEREKRGYRPGTTGQSAADKRGYRPDANGQSAADRVLEDLAVKLGVNSQKDGRVTPVTAVQSTSPPNAGNNAINDTVKVQKTKSRLYEDNKPYTEAGDHTNLENLRKVLVGLEGNIDEFEKLTGREPSSRQTAGDGDTLTGFTGRLVSAVNKMSRYLKENELRLRAEMTLREQLHQDVTYLKTLVDTLTGDIIATQEQYVGLQSEFVNYRKETMEQIAAIKEGLFSRGIPVHTFVQPTPQIPPKSQLTAESQRAQETAQTQASEQLAAPPSVPLFHPRPVISNSVSQQSADVTLLQSQEDLRRDLVKAQEMSDMLTADSRRDVSASSALPLGYPRQTDSPKAVAKKSTQNLPDKKHFQHSNWPSVAPLPRSSLSEGNISVFHQPKMSVHHERTTQPSSYNTSQPPRPPAQASNSATSLGVHNTSTTGLHPGTKSVPVQNGEYRGAFQPIVATNGGDDYLRNEQGSGDCPSTQWRVPQSQSVAVNQVVNQPRGAYSSDGRHMEATMQLPGSQPAPHTFHDHNWPGEEKSAPLQMSNKLEQQIEELNRQHAEAQSKLQQLMNQQTHVDNKLVMSQAIVSPPISPITVESEVETQEQRRQIQIDRIHSDQAKEIKVLIPRVENMIELQNHGK